jgi:hypothetical protein
MYYFWLCVRGRQGSAIDNTKGKNTAREYMVAAKIIMD